MAAKQITMAEVQKHNTSQDLWVVIENKVYDLSKYRKKHPGGTKVLDKVAGTDATKDFQDVGHSTKARTLMADFLVGELAESDRTTSGNCRLKS